QWLYDFEVASGYSYIYEILVKNIHKGTMHNVSVFLDPARSISYYFANVEQIDGCDTILPKSECAFKFNITVTDNLNAEVDDVLPARLYWIFNWTNNDGTYKKCGFSCTTPTIPSMTSFSTRFYVYSLPNFTVSPTSIIIDSDLSVPHYIDIYINNTGNDKIDRINVSQPFPEHPEYVQMSSYFESNNNSVWDGEGWDLLSVGEYNILRLNITMTNYTKATYNRSINFTSKTVAIQDPTASINLLIDVNPELTHATTLYKELSHNKDNIFNFTISSTGNIRVNDVNMTYEPKLLPGSIRLLPKSWVNFDGDLGTLYEEDIYKVLFNISIPQFTLPGNYSGQFTIESSNTPTTIVNFTVFVKPEGLWEFVTPTYQYLGDFPLDYDGNVGNVTIFNPGNLDMDFFIQRFDANTNCTGTSTGCVEDPSDDRNAFNYHLPINSTLDLPVYVVPVLTGDMKMIQVLVAVTTPNSAPFSNSSYVAYLTVDYPPTINQQKTVVGGFNYNKIALGKPVTLIAQIRDDLGVDYENSYFNVTMPNGTIHHLTALENETLDTRLGAGATLVNLEYEYTQASLEGNYSFLVYTKDDSGHVTQQSMEFYVIGETDVDIFAGNVSTADVTFVNSTLIEVPITVTNVGLVFAYGVNITIQQLPPGWVAIDSSVYYELLNVGQTKFNMTIQVPEGTLAGDYNITYKLIWDAPNQGNDSATGDVTVDPNHYYTITGLSSNYDINHDAHNLVSFDVIALGNEPGDIRIKCNGEPQDIIAKVSTNNNLSTFSNQVYLTNMPINSTTTIYLDMNVTRGAVPGSTGRQFNLSFTDATNIDDYTKIITPNVRVSKAWNLSKTFISEGGVALLNITYNDLVITSNANVPLNFMAFLSGNITDFDNPAYVDPQHNETGYGMIISNATTFTLPKTVSRPISLFYKVPDLNANFKGDITVVDVNNASSVKIVPINFRSYKFISELYDVFPTSVNETDTITFTTNLTLGGEYITDNMTYLAYVGDNECLNIQNITPIGEFTTLTCNAPAPSDTGASYDFRVITRYYSSEIQNYVNIPATLQDYIYYYDLEPPYYDKMWVNDAQYGNPVKITVYVEDNKDVGNVSVNITFPGSSSYLILDLSQDNSNPSAVGNWSRTFTTGQSGTLDEKGYYYVSFILTD
ncbi:MAG: hypothetical protein DRN14_05945, partial [Thermoplasmata archaeon]